jgi:hypothetical protein
MCDCRGVIIDPRGTVLVLWPQARQVAKSERTPRLRMLPSVIGLVGSSERGIDAHSTPGRDVSEQVWRADQFKHHRPVEAAGL